MRKIQTQDVFKLAKAIKIADIKKDLADTMKSATAEGNGIDLMMVLFSACGDDKVEAILYELIADIAEVKASAIKTMEFTELIEILKEIAKANDLTSFFGSAVKLT